MKRINIGIMASGGGSNARCIMESCRMGKIQADCSVVISNKQDAGVHEHAKEYSIPSIFLARDQFTQGNQFAQKLISTFHEYKVDLIVLAGYMRKIPPSLIREWQNAILNIHPALLPAYGGKGMYGIRVHQAVLDAGEKFSGVTVHYVNSEYDEGPILYQEGNVPIMKDDTAHTLAARVLKLEHQAYSKAIQIWIEKRIGS